MNFVERVEMGARRETAVAQVSESTIIKLKEQVYKADGLTAH